jgi:aldose sugar dehydrogenase
MKKIIIVSIILSSCYNVFSQPYITEQLIFNLSSPVAFTFLPNTNVLITQKAGLSVIYALNNVFVSNFWNFTDSTISSGERGLLGVCLDPNYASNHYVYFYYTHNPNIYRVVRLTENNNAGTNPFIVFSDTSGVMNSVHVGGNIRFGPGGKLYITIGNNGPDSNSQTLRNFKGKILRVNSNGTIPTDNPFYDDGNPHTGNDDRIWAYGLRNSFDFCFSPFNDSLYATENGTVGYDEANFIRKGKNYGYPICQGFCNPYNPLYRNPMEVWGWMPSTGSYAPTGILIYNGSQMPELTGKVIVAGINGNPGGIFKCTLNASADSIIFKDTLVHQGYITTLLQGTDGYIYALYYGYLPTQGGLLRIKPNPFGIINGNTPVYYSLEQNYPNPFNNKSKIKYQISNSSNVKLTVYDVFGREVETLVNEKQQPGAYEVEWDATEYSSGVYCYTMRAGDASTPLRMTETKKMVLIK